jgi:predicted transcriptional regulator
MAKDVRPGRPPKAPGLRKRNNLTVRLNDERKLALEEHAIRTQRSLSEEIEACIEQVFHDYSDTRTAAVLRMLAEITSVVVAVRRGQHWLDDYAGFQAVKERWNQYLETLRPDASKDLIDRANFALSKIAEAHDSGDRQKTLEAASWLSLSGLPAPMLGTALSRASAYSGIPVEELANAHLNMKPGEWAIENIPAPGDRKRHMRFYGPPEDAPPGAEVMPYVPVSRGVDDDTAEKK